MVARLDARPPGLRMVTVSILMTSNILSWRLGHEVISTGILSGLLIQEGQ